MAMSHGLVEQNGRANEVPGFGPAAFLLFAGRPLIINIFANPKYTRSDFPNVGVYAQDLRRIDRFTLNLGVRFDMFDGWSSTQTTPDTPFVPGFTTQRINDTPTWRDVSPRPGVAYDLAGDGKTASVLSVKPAGSYPLPFGIGLSAVYQNLPGLQVLANGVFSRADVAGSLGRNLNSGTVTVLLIQPFTQFEERVNHLDFRLAGVLRRGGFGRVRLTLDLFNMTNASTVLVRSNTFSTAAAGAGWGTPTTITAGRLIKIVAQYSF